MRHPKSDLLVAGYMIMLILGLLLSSCMPEQSPEIKPDADSASNPPKPPKCSQTLLNPVHPTDVLL